MTVSINLDRDSLKYRPEDGKLYFTYRDISSLPEWPESPLIELTGGELFVVPSPSTRHQQISGNLYFELRKIIEVNKLGTIFTAPIDVKLSDEDLVIPDLVFISESRNQIVKDKFVDGSPDFIIEILSSNEQRDRKEKYELYQNFQVKEYIIIEPKAELIRHFILDEKSGKYVTFQGDNDNNLVLSTLEGITIERKNIFA